MILSSHTRLAESFDKHTPGEYLREALDQLGLARPGLGWYEATRHTFASQWVMAGRSIEELKEILGHYSVVVTERYAHLRPDLFAAGAHQALKVDLSATAGDVVSMGKTGENGQSMASKPASGVTNRRKHRIKTGAAL